MATAKRQRSYPGEELADPLVKWLNRQPSKELVSLLELAQRHRKATDSNAPGKRKLGKLLQDTINSITLGYLYNPVVERIDRRWKVEWCAQDGRGPEAVMLLFVIDLAQQGLFHRVTRCGNPKCGRWFFAITDVQRFHSPACALKAFRSTAKFKERHKKYMHDWRNEHPEHKLTRGKR